MKLQSESIASLSLGLNLPVAEFPDGDALVAALIPGCDAIVPVHHESEHKSRQLLQRVRELDAGIP